MTIEMPLGKRMAVAVTVDFDAHSMWMGGYGRQSPSVLARGEFGVEVGVPRLLQTLGELGIEATWFIPAHDLLTFPRAVEDVMGHGHEVAAHGQYSEKLRELEPGLERELMASQLETHRTVTGLTPRGYRAPSWDFSSDTIAILDDFGLDWDSSLMGREFEPYFPRPVTVAYEGANIFGEPSAFLEFPVSWYLNDWTATEYVPGISAQMGSHQLMFQRWQDIFEYAHSRVDGALMTITLHPQTVGRGHLMPRLDAFLREIVDTGNVWLTGLSNVFDSFQSD